MGAASNPGAATSPEAEGLGSPSGEPVPEPAEPESIAILHVATMSKYEKDKVKRIVCPKPTTGNLAVPRDIYELWQTEKGKEKLLQMWCKSGGMKARPVFLHVYGIHHTSFIFKFDVEPTQVNKSHVENSNPVSGST